MLPIVMTSGNRPSFGIWPCFRPSFHPVKLFGALAILAWPAPLPGYSQAPATHANLSIAPASTTTAVARLTLTVGVLTWQAGVYRGGFQMKVVPLFFLSDKGTLAAKVPDDAFRKLAAGEGIDFAGSAVSEKGKNLPISGHATPLAPDHGTIRLSFPGAAGTIFFNSTYRLIGN